MTIKAIYSNQDEIPENLRDYYQEREGRYQLVQIEGLKTDADIARLQRALDSEKSERARIKDQFEGILKGKKPEELLSILDRIPELEAAASGKIDEEKLSSIVESRLKTKIAPVERQLDQTRALLQEAESKLDTYAQKEIKRAVHDSVRQAAQRLKVVDSAQEDVLMLSERMFEVNSDGSVTVKDGVGHTPGINADVWLMEMQQKRPHWWPPSQGGGARGSSGGGGFPQNPWSSEHWNLTKQGEVIRLHGAEKAEQMAASAGTKVGVLRPPVKK